MEYEDNDYELLYLISEDNEEAKELFYKKYKPTIEVKAKKYYPMVKTSGIELNDLIQEGMIGLSKAINDYQEQKNIKFVTFASTCIERQLLSFVRGVTRDKHKLLNSSLSIDTTTNSTGRPLKDVVSDNKNTNPENLFIENEIATELDNEISKKLSNQEREVFLLRMKGFSYKEIAVLLNITPKSVERTIARAKNKIENIKQSN